MLIVPVDQMSSTFIFDFNPRTKKLGNLTDFSHSNWGSTLEGWMANIERLSDCRWDTIVGLCSDGMKVKKMNRVNDNAAGDISLLEANHSQIYMASSP